MLQKLTYYNYTHPKTKVFRYEYLTDYEKFIDKETTNLQKLQIEIQSTFYKAKYNCQKIPHFHSFTTLTLNSS